MHTGQHVHFHKYNIFIVIHTIDSDSIEIIAQVQRLCIRSKTHTFLVNWYNKYRIFRYNGVDL